MALYGLLVSAPLSHVMVGALQDAFKGRSGALASLAQIVVSNLTVGPVQAAGEFGLVLVFLVVVCEERGE